MNEQRRSQRIKYSGSGWLQHNGAQYFCRLENISLHGALVGLKGSPVRLIPHGEQCCLRFYQGGEKRQYRDFAAQVIRFESAEVGLEFVEGEGAPKDVLEAIIRKERRVFAGADNIINLAREIAKLRGIWLTDVHFDKGELIPEREIHILRVFSGEQTASVHLHRVDIEEFAGRNDGMPARMQIHKAIDRLQEGVASRAEKFVVNALWKGVGNVS